MENQQQEYTVQQKTATKDMTIGNWLVTMLLTAIPFVGIVMLFIWAFGQPDARKTYAQAYLIWTAISLVLMIIYIVFLGGILATVDGY